jgi:hypothetical protein
MKITKGQKLYFTGEKLPYTVRAASNRFAVVSRNFDRLEDEELLWWEVKRGAAYSIDSAYEYSKELPVYSLLDFENNKRSTDNLVFGVYDYFDESDCEIVLRDLENGEMELSHRNITELEIEVKE